MDGLAGKAAVITGAASGVGFAAAELMARRGARVLLADRDAQRCEQAADQIEQNGGTAVPTTVDVTDGDSIAGMVDQALSAFGELHVLCNHVGGSDPSTGQCLVVDGGTTSQSAFAPGRRTGALTDDAP